MTSARPFLSLVIPAYNEEERICVTLCEVLSYLARADFAWEVIISDDGSEDGTVGVVRSLALSSPISVLTNGHRGKGEAVKRGILAARGEYVGFMDADHSTRVEEVPRALEAMRSGFDIVIGSRGKDANIVRHQPFYREYMGKVFSKLVSICVMREFEDTQCGFKLFRRQVARELFARQRIEGFAFDVEILYMACRMGFRVKEMPITWANSEKTTVNALTDSVRMLRDLLLVRKLHGAEELPAGRHVTPLPAGEQVDSEAPDDLMAA